MKDKFEIKDNVAIIKINKNIYPKEVLTQATYVKLEEYYFLIDEEDNRYIIEMQLKNEKEIGEKDVKEFFDELIESQSYIDQLKRSSKIRQTILERALFSQKK